MEDFWFREYDEESFEKDFLRINYIKYLSLNEGHPPSIEADMLSKNRIECLLQNQLLEQLELLDSFFLEVSTINNDELMEFASLMNIFLQVERFYYVKFWDEELQISQDFLINRLVASFMRYLKFFKSFHRTLFTYNKVMIVQTQTGIRSAVDRSQYCSLEEIESDIALPIEDLRAFIEYFNVSYSNIKRTFSKSSLLFEKERVIFDKILLYIENFLTKSMDTINQEAKVLYGDVERSLQDIILKNNKLAIKSFEELEKEQRYMENNRKNMDDEDLMKLTQEEIDFLCQEARQRPDNDFTQSGPLNTDRKDSNSSRKDSKMHKNTMVNKRTTKAQNVTGYNLMKSGLQGTIVNTQKMKSIAISGISGKKTMVSDQLAFNLKVNPQKRGSNQEDRGRENKRDQYSSSVIKKVENCEGDYHLENVYDSVTYLKSPNLPTNLKDSILSYFMDVTSGGTGHDYFHRREEELMRGQSWNHNESLGSDFKKRDVKDLLDERLNEDLVSFIKLTGPEIINIQEDEIKKEEKEEGGILKENKNKKKGGLKTAHFNTDGNNTTLGNSQKTEENENRASTTLEAEKLEREKAEKKKERKKKKGNNKDELKNRRVNKQQFIEIDANYEIKEKLQYEAFSEDETKEGHDTQIFEYDFKEEKEQPEREDNNPNNYNSLIALVDAMRQREAILLTRVKTVTRWRAIKNFIQCESLDKYISNKYMDDKISMDAKKRDMNFKSRHKKLCSNFFGSVNYKSF